MQATWVQSSDYERVATSILRTIRTFLTTLTRDCLSPMCCRTSHIAKSVNCYLMFRPINRRPDMTKHNMVDLLFEYSTLWKLYADYCIRDLQNTHNGRNMHKPKMTKTKHLNHPRKSETWKQFFFIKKSRSRSRDGTSRNFTYLTCPIVEDIAIRRCANMDIDRTVMLSQSKGSLAFRTDGKTRKGDAVWMTNN